MNAKRAPSINEHDKMVAEWMKDPEFCAEYERQDEEFALLDELLAARKQAGLTQAQVAERMGTKATAITRLESGLASGMQTPSYATLKKYAAAVGKKLQVRLV
ncbi:helix-turn-helix domain-containing protein [Serratia marcescens]|uniref:helix-turn-helix domain-containing protein n=1 Tax=Serratia marcescens TaxID=615 RepID=UPI001249DABD|nr:helix-turn-helix transcriptional regulator [Serratia marcescens]KAB1578740.1 helix-turn-helix transcriptional regulator [Serratia marcescens]